ncbi:carbon-nitrogen hydrolase family protein [Arthrobacter pigmenti]
MTRPLPLALVQAPAHPANDLASFASRLEQLTRFYPTTQLFVYPEMHLCGAGVVDSSEAEPGKELAAEPIDGPRDDFLAGLAGDLKIWLAPGSFYERGDDGRLYNTAAVYSPAGQRVAAYRKVFPWRPIETLSPGSDFVVFDMDGIGRVGLSICYDAWFPESSRHLAWMGAELILNFVQTPTADRPQELTLARANAIVNQVYVASVNAAAPQGVGQSLLVDPQGRPMAVAPGAESTVLTDVIDLDEVVNVRKFGTAGVSRPWQQFSPDDEPVELPLYSGRINPAAWQVGTKSEAGRELPA